jgi:hypothetical protein
VQNGIEAGYIIRQRFNNAATGLFDWIYAAFTNKEEAKEFAQSIINQHFLPSTENPSMDGEPCPENPAMVEPSPDNPSMDTYIDKENKKEEKQSREDPPTPTADFLLDEIQQQPTPQLLASLSKEPESLHQNEDPSSVPVVPNLFGKPELSNIVLFPDVADHSSRDAAKRQKYQQLDADGIKLKQPELRDWAALEIGQYVKTYRKSGFILTGGNDVSCEFAIYVAKQNCKKGQEPTITLGFNAINKWENNPRCWQKLAIWVTEWQQQRQTGQSVNVAAAVNHQQEIQRIRQAANTKFEL